MFALLCFVLAVLPSPFKSKSRLEAENMALRQHGLQVAGQVLLLHIMESSRTSCLLVWDEQQASFSNWI